jgi:hypothetical protein
MGLLAFVSPSEYTEAPFLSIRIRRVPHQGIPWRNRMQDPGWPSRVHTRLVCPQCQRTTITHLEQVIRGDVVTSTWTCDCGTSWPADRDVVPAKAEADTERSADTAVLADLRDLVAALDRRLPQRDSRRERLVSAMSATLREQAMDRITSLEEPADCAGAMPRREVN